MIDIDTLSATATTGRPAPSASTDDAPGVRDAAEPRDRLGDFLSVAAHELRTPLNALKLQADNLQRMVERCEGDPPRERVLVRLEPIHAQIDRIDLLIHTLLDASRIGAGKLDLARDRVELVALAHASVERLFDAFVAAGCDVYVHHDPEVRIVADRTRIDRAITNLLTNAMKYGRGDRIDIEVRREGDFARVSVSDHGIGIDPAEQQRIFGRFQRVAETESYGGLGLGLWITREIVRAHGGVVRVESRRGEGATFTIELPAQARDGDANANWT